MLPVVQSRAVVTASLALIALLASGCAINPVSGRPEVVLMSEEREREIGREETEKVEQAMGFVEESRLTRYVEALGRRLAEHSPRQGVEYRFYVVDMVEANAFALPGGHVFVSRGLLALANSEDELAAVVGHEVGHVAARHHVQRQTLGTPFAIATGLPALAAGLVLPGLGRAVAGVGQFASGLVLAPYSREQEREADRVGQDIAAAAGWDPAALASFLHTLEREAALRSGEPRFRIRYFDSHPRLPERVSKTRIRAEEVERGPANPIAGGHAEFLRKLDGLRIGQSPAEGVFVENRFLHPDLNFSLSFPEGWQTQNARNYVGAREPQGEALAVLEVAGKGEELLEAARAFEKMSGARLEDPQPLSIGGLKALRSAGSHRSSRLDLTWIAYEGYVYQITGVSPTDKFETHRDDLSKAALSFRRITKAERSKIEDTRLRIIPAEGGEAFEQILKRTKGTWTPEETAVANGLSLADSLQTGQLLKIPIREPYTR